MKNLVFKPYSKENFDTCLKIFRSNVPKYFDESEEPDFVDWLNQTGKHPYFLVIANEIPVGCGGIFFNKTKNKAGFAWGMIHQKFHKQGFGLALSKFRLSLLDKEAPNCIHELNTSQFTFKFFEKVGFSVHSITKDGWAKGIDKYYMVRKK